MQTIQQKLFALQDKEYRDFTAKLIPTVPKETVIGIRTPELRRLAKLLTETEAEKFLSKLPHKYYEENNLHAFLIELIPDFSLCISELNRFLPYIDNWATCDSLRPKCFKKHKTELLNQIDIWLKSEDTYTVRYAIEALMTYFLDADFKIEFAERVAEIKSGQYYVNMMIAWYFATALAKQYESVLPFLEQNRLDLWVHNKTIQKAVESLRVTSQQKEYLKTLKRKL